MSGFLSLKNMNSGKIDTMSLSHQPVKNTFFTESGMKVILQVYIPPSLETFPFPHMKGINRFIVYPIESILNGQLTGILPIVDIEAMAGIIFCKKKSIFVGYSQNTLYTWIIDENGSYHDEGIPIESIIQSEQNVD